MTTDIAIEFDISEKAFDAEFKEVQVTGGGGISPVDKIVSKEEVIAAIPTRAILSVDVHSGGANAYIEVEEQDPDTGVWGRSQYREIWDKHEYPNLDLTSAVGLTDSEKADIRTNIGAVSAEELETTNANVFSLITDVTLIDGRVSELEADVGNIDTVLESIIAMQNELIGGDA